MAWLQTSYTSILINSAGDYTANTFRFKTLVGKSTFGFTGAGVMEQSTSMKEALDSRSHFKMGVKKWLLPITTQEDALHFCSTTAFKRMCCGSFKM